MGVNKRHITDKMILALYQTDGVDRVIKLYQKADVITLEGDLSKEISNILNDPEMLLVDPLTIKDRVLHEIYNVLGIKVTKK